MVLTMLLCFFFSEYFLGFSIATGLILVVVT